MDSFNYEFVLNRACIQFEPFEQEFHTITSTVYQHIDEHKRFDVLRSTRHFGPMCFFLAWHKIIDNLVIDMIDRDLLRNGVELICLLYKLNGIKYNEQILVELEKLANQKDVSSSETLLSIGQSDLNQEIQNNVGKTADDFKIDEISFQFIQDFSKNHGVKKSKIEASLQTYQELNNEKRRLFEGLRKAHGIS